MDLGLRIAERAWREAPSPETHGAWLRERVRMGNLSAECVAFAASLGSAGSRLALGEDWDGPCPQRVCGFPAPHTRAKHHDQRRDSTLPIWVLLVMEPAALSIRDPVHRFTRECYARALIAGGRRLYDKGAMIPEWLRQPEGAAVRLVVPEWFGNVLNMADYLVSHWSGNVRSNIGLFSLAHDERRMQHPGWYEVAVGIETALDDRQWDHYSSAGRSRAMAGFSGLERLCRAGETREVRQAMEDELVAWALRVE